MKPAARAVLAFVLAVLVGAACSGGEDPESHEFRLRAASGAPVPSESDLERSVAILRNRLEHAGIAARA